MAGNFGIILGIMRRKGESHIVGSVFLINLAVIDVLLCLAAVPITPITSVYKEWYFGDLLCKLVPMIQVRFIIYHTRDMQQGFSRVLSQIKASTIQNKSESREWQCW